MAADGLLLLCTVFWGLTFVLVKEALGKVGAFLFLAQRFFLAFAVLSILSLFRRRRLTAAALGRGTLLGCFLFGAFAFQTVALQYTTASNAAFLTGLNVIIVPALGALIYCYRVPWTVKAGVLLASIGLLLLCTQGRWSLNPGDILAGLCALFVALHVIFTGRYARESDVVLLTTVQIGFIALASGMLAVLLGDSPWRWHGEIFWSLLICALFATVFTFLIQTAMQRYTSAAHTALVFCMEPVFGAIFAALMLGERLGPWGIVGAVLILAGIILSEAPRSRQFSTKQTDV